MSFFLYDITFLIIFGIFLTVFLILKKRNLQREGVLIIYRTQLGIKIINHVAKKYKKFLDKLEYLLIFTGYVLMLAMLYLLFQLVYIFFKFPEFIRVIKMPPIMPLIPYLPKIFKIEFLPPFYFTYWIIVLAIAAVSHEFCHGIFARAKGIKIKSTGFAFLGPFTGAFVEPDENKVKKLKVRKQLGFLAAGTFANIIMALFFFLVIWLFFVSVFSPAGVIFNSYTYNIINASEIESIGENLFVNFDSGLNLTEISVKGEKYYAKNDGLKENQEYVIAYEDTPALKSSLAGVIIEFNGEEIKTNQDLKRELLNKKPGDEVSVKTLLNESVKEYNLKLTYRPDDEEQAYLGIALIRTGGLSLLSKLTSGVLFFKDPNTYYKPKFASDLMIFIYNLIWWIILVNFSVGLVNMLPVGIFDGGRVFFLTIFALTKSEKIARGAFRLVTYFIIFIFLLLTCLWFIGIR